MRASLKRSMTGVSMVVGLLMLLTSLSVAAQTPAGSQLVPASSTPPGAYGTTDYTVTTIAGLGFVPSSNGLIYNVSGSLARAVNAIGGHFYSALDIPAGSVIDFIGFNNLNDETPNVMAIHLWVRDASGNAGLLYSLSNTPHLLGRLTSIPYRLASSGPAARGLVSPSYSIWKSPQARTHSSSGRWKSGGSALSAQRQAPRPSTTCRQITLSSSTSRR